MNHSRETAEQTININLQSKHCSLRQNIPVDHNLSEGAELQYKLLRLRAQDADKL